MAKKKKVVKEEKAAIEDLDPTDVKIDAGLAATLGITLQELQKCYDSFQSADMDGSGYVSHDELKKVLSAVYEHPLSEKDIAKLFLDHDKDGSGSLDFYEFMQVYCNTPLHKAEHLEAMISKIGNDIRKGMLGSRTTPEDAVQSGHVKMGSVKNYVKDELNQMEACMQLPYAVVIFVAFTMSVMIHERVEEIHAMDKAITWDVMENANFAFSGTVPFENGRMGHKSVMNVNSAEDFWSWFNLGLVPLFWPEGWDVSEARSNTLAMCTRPRDALESFGWNATVLADMSPGEPELGGPCPEGHDMPQSPLDLFGSPQSPTPTYLLFHTIVGGVRLRQERFEEYECPAGDSFQGDLRAGPCVESSGYWLDPDPRASLVSDPERVDQPGGEDVYLLSGTAQKDIRKQLQALELRRWVGPHTGKVEIIYTTYNSHMDVFTATYILYFMNLGGHIYRRIQPVSFPMTPYHNIWCYLSDCLWLAMIMKIVVEESVNLVKHWKAFGFVKGNRLYWGVETAVDWAHILCFIGIGALWLRHIWKVDQLRNILMQTELGVQGSFPRADVRAEFYNHIDDFVQDIEFRRNILAVYPFIVVVRFFKAFSAQPRLALVTNTISMAGTDLFHFGLVFMCIFLLFAISATLLFGRDVSEFATLERSLNSCFRCLLGDFEWKDMRETGRTPASIWFWGFTWLVNLVMLNMLLAIVMDIYTEVRGSIGDNAETLWSQAGEIWRRHRQKQRGERVSLEYILECIEPLGFMAKGIVDENDEKPLTTQGFVDLVPGLAERQASRILLASENKLREGEHESQSISDAIVGIQRISGRVEQLHEAFQNVTAIGEMSATMQMQLSKSVSESKHQAHLAAQLLAQSSEQKDSNGVASAPDADPGLPSWFDELYERHASKFLDRCDQIENQVEGRMHSLATEVTKVTNMVNAVAPMKGSLASVRQAYVQPPSARAGSRAAKAPAGPDPRDLRSIPPLPNGAAPPPKGAAPPP